LNSFILENKRSREEGLLCISKTLESWREGVEEEEQQEEAGSQKGFGTN
jgi:hypothetical protein